MLQVICATAACAALPACAGLHPLPNRDLGSRATPLRNALRCDRLATTAAESALVVPGKKGHVDVKFPRSHSVAALRVPRAAVSDSTIFILQIERGATSRALINVAARHGAESVTTFNEPLLLKLNVRSGCKPSKPAKDSTFYVYTLQVDPSTNDTTLVDGHGDYIDPLILGSKRVEAVLQHLSGFILAQGLR
jgi:hypothetical protein